LKAALVSFDRAAIILAREVTPQSGRFTSLPPRRTEPGTGIQQQQSSKSPRRLSKSRGG